MNMWRALPGATRLIGDGSSMGNGIDMKKKPFPLILNEIWRALDAETVKRNHGEWKWKRGSELQSSHKAC